MEIDASYKGNKSYAIIIKVTITLLLIYLIIFFTNLYLLRRDTQLLTISIREKIHELDRSNAALASKLRSNRVLTNKPLKINSIDPGIISLDSTINKPTIIFQKPSEKIWVKIRTWT